MRRASDVSRALQQARSGARLTLADVGRALDVHPRTIRRWELGESKPRERQWPRVLAFYAQRGPGIAQTLAAAVGRAIPPSVTAAAADPHLASRVIAMTADALDVAPRRVREVLEASARAAVEAGVAFPSFARLLAAEADLARRAEPPHSQ